MIGGGAVDRWQARKLIVKAIKVAQAAGKDETEQVKIAAVALLMKYPDMSIRPVTAAERGVAGSG